MLYVQGTHKQGPEQLSFTHISASAYKTEFHLQQ